MGDAGEYEATFRYYSPLSNEDAADTRWLLEDHPRLRGRSSDPIAARIEDRLHKLAADLRHAVFESAEEARPISEALAQTKLLNRLHVTVDEPQTAPWTPWELMLAPSSSDPLSVLAASFSRISTSTSPAKPRVKSDKLRILLVTSRPSGEDDVPFRSVASRIVQAVAASTESSIQVDLLRPPTYSALLDALAAASQTEAPYNVVHFDGHGSYDADAFDESKRGYLYFEGLDGSTEEVSGSILGADLAQHAVSYLLLNACRSAYTEPNALGGDDTASAAERAFGTLAAEVRAKGVAGVLAMGFNLYVVTAAGLIANVYAALAARRTLSEAVAHARRELYHAETNIVGAFDWLVPIAFSGEAIEEDDGREAITTLNVQASTTTPASAGVVDPGAGGGSRSDEHPFFGYDGILLRLDRACGASRSVEIVGMAGAGKSAVAGEFARWWVATTPDVAVVLDVDSAGSFDEFNEQFQKQWAQAQEQATDGACLMVVDGASNILANGSETWSVEDRTAFKEWIEQQFDSSRWLLLTGRAPSGLTGVETILLNGLDTESRAELAAHVGFDQEYASSFPGMLRWSQGLPAVVRLIPLIIEGLPLGDRALTRKLLTDLRSGTTHTSGLQLGIALIERSGLAFFDVRHLRRAALPFVLHLFQSYIADQQWWVFCELAAMKGLNLTSGGDVRAVLDEEFRPAVRAGLVSRESHGYLLHPLAPIAIQNGFAGTLQVITRGNPDLVRHVWGTAWSSYIQSVSTTMRMAEMSPKGGEFGAVSLQRENLTNAVEISVLGAWWGLALPLLHKLRDTLLAEARNDEWREILDGVFARLQESPPQEEEMGPENAAIHIVRLLAEEAKRDGDEEKSRALRELQVQIAYAHDTTITPVEADEGKEIDVGRIRRISSLLKLGDAAASDNSPDAIDFYSEALRLAEDPPDLLRLGEVHYAIARAYLNVTALRDPAKYEFHAREAIKAAAALGPFGLDLHVRASVSLGNAIVEEQRSREEPDSERLNQARKALTIGVTSENAGPITRGTAHNGLGNLYRIEKDLEAAADEYLAACKQFETAGDIRSLRAAQANAALTLASLGRTEDARSLAAEALKDAAQ
jgi:tetratricopeptide (TPR) repeat protein